MISIIIPTLNEERWLPSVLNSIVSQKSKYEIILIDGGSDDNTLKIAQKHSCKILLSTKANRAHQMNLGAQAAIGDILLFLHADTLLSEDALETIENRNPKYIGGAFRRRFDSPSILLSVTCRLADWRGALFGWFLGDSTIFVNRKSFEKLGGYRNLPQLEDLDFSRRMKRKGPVVLLNPIVISSARRFRTGILKTILTDFWLMACFPMRAVRE